MHPTHIKRHSMEKTYKINATEAAEPVPTQRQHRGGGGSSIKTTPTPMPTATPAATQEAQPTEEPVNNPFTDIASDDWFYDSVMTAYTDGIMNGVSDKKFAPNTDITRGMFVTVLYRMEGEPETSAVYSFEDVPADEYYANAVTGASENGIVEGYSDTEYAPDGMITREQMAVITYRCAKFKKVDLSVNSAPEYADSGDISDYAKDAVAWSSENGILQGSDDNTFAPQANTTRAQAAAIFTRTAESFLEGSELR